MTNGEKIQTILDVDRDCIDVHGENGTMTFTVTQDFWFSEYEESITKNDLGVDCISKADARRLICKIDRKYMFGISRKAFKDLYNGIDDLPSATLQKPKTGRWIEDKCTNCGYEVQPWNTTNFCPNCGAKMEEVKE